MSDLRQGSWWNPGGISDRYLLRDPFTNKPMVQFYAYRRVGGDVANSEAIKVLKVAVS